MLCSLGRVGPRARQAFLQGHTRSLPACEVPRALQGWGHCPLWGKARRGGEETCPTEPAQQRPGSDGVTVWGLLPQGRTVGGNEEERPPAGEPMCLPSPKGREGGWRTLGEPLRSHTLCRPLLPPGGPPAHQQAGKAEAPPPRRWWWPWQQGDGAPWGRRADTGPDVLPREPTSADSPSDLVRGAEAQGRTGNRSRSQDSAVQPNHCPAGAGGPS